VIAIYAVEEVKGQTCLLMEYVPGPSLQEQLKRTGPLGVPEIIRIGAQVASGLAAAHALGVVHRDIKPANILLEEGSGRVKITDFGLARAADHPRLTQSGVLVGTPEYMAPEQARGEPVDHRADLFSLGSALYALCTGRSPFRAGSTVAVLRRLCEEEPVPVRDLNPAVPGWLVRVIEQLHAKDPDERCQSAAEVAALLTGHPAAGPTRRVVRDRESSGDTTLLGPPPGFPWGWVAVGAGALLAVLIMVVAAALYLPPGSDELSDPPEPGQEKPVAAIPDRLRAGAPRLPGRLLPEPKNADLRSLLLSLKADNQQTRLEAATQLEQMQPIEAEREAVAGALEQQLDDPAHFTRQAMIRALGVWGTRDSVPALIGLLQHQDVFTRRSALLALGKFRDERAAEAVAGGLEDLNRHYASQALQMMGPVAEGAVAQRLGHNDWSIRREACAILKVIGTSRSIPALEAAAGDGNGIVAGEAKTALEVIKARR
jgi:serine/threonine protein kinase